MSDQQVPEFSEQHMIDGIPVPYILHQLHQLGPQYFNDKSTAFAELRVEGVDRPFYVHKEYLVLQSSFFKDLFRDVSGGDIVSISVPAPEAFERILEYLYDGDGDKWYESLTTENYYDVWENVEYLRLHPQAKAVCTAFYEAEVDSE